MGARKYSTNLFTDAQYREMQAECGKYTAAIQDYINTYGYNHFVLYNHTQEKRIFVEIDEDTTQEVLAILSYQHDRSFAVEGAHIIYKVIKDDRTIFLAAVDLKMPVKKKDIYIVDRSEVV